MNSEELKLEISKFDPPEKEKRKNAFISLYYIVVLVLIGIPMWFITTTTYRASLPTSQISQLAKAKIPILVKINIINFNGNLELDDLFKLQDELFQDFEKKSDRNAIVGFVYSGFVRQAERDEMKMLQLAKNVSDLDGIVTNVEPNGIYFLLMPDRSNLLEGNNKHGLIRTRTDRSVAVLPSDSIDAVKRTISDILGDILSTNDDLNTVYQAATRVPDKTSLNNVPDRIRSFFTRVRSSPNYRWTFSLIVPKPKRGSLIEWDFPRLERIFLEPLIRKLAPFVSISVSSQIVYGVRLERVWRGDLTHLVNSLESYLGSTNGANNELNFVCILHSSDSTQFLKGNRGIDAFTVPRWGGISLINTNNHNTNENNTSQSTINRSIDEGTLAGLFLPQILTIMGLTRSSSVKSTATTSGISIEPIGDGVFLSPWELDNWLRERTVENLAITRVTLQSIVGLLDKVVNMVIRDDVAANIISATKLAKNSLDALKSRSVSNSLQIAFLSSKQALEAAENAFFHPSLLELLYFQDDQKIGIYIPLFVPMIIPVVLAALKAKPYLLTLIKTKTD